MNPVNAFGVGISEFGMAFMSLTAYSQMDFYYSLFGGIIWLIGLFMLFFDRGEESMIKGGEYNV